MHTQRGHTDHVYALEMLESSASLANRVASGSADQSVKIWDMDAGVCLATLVGHTGNVYALKQLPGERLASGSRDKTIRIWSLETQACLHTLTGHTDEINALEHVPGAVDLLVSASGDKDRSVKLWNMHTFKCVCTLRGHSGFVFALKWIEASKCLATASKDKTIRLWRRKITNDDGLFDLQQTFVGHANTVFALEMVGESTLASGSADKTIRLWNVHNGECVRVINTLDFVKALLVMPNGRLASASRDIRVWDWHTGKCELTIRANLNSNWNLLALKMLN